MKFTGKVDPVSFRVTRETESEFDQSLVIISQGGHPSERRLVASEGYLNSEQIPTEAYMAMWRAITTGKGIAR